MSPLKEEDEKCRKIVARTVVECLNSIDNLHDEVKAGLTYVMARLVADPDSKDEMKENIIAISREYDISEGFLFVLITDIFTVCEMVLTEEERGEQTLH